MSSLGVGKVQDKPHPRAFCGQSVAEGTTTADQNPLSIAVNSLVGMNNIATLLTSGSLALLCSTVRSFLGMDDYVQIVKSQLYLCGFKSIVLEGFDSFS